MTDERAEVVPGRVSLVISIDPTSKVSIPIRISGGISTTLCASPIASVVVVKLPVGLAGLSAIVSRSEMPGFR